MPTATLTPAERHLKHLRKDIAAVPKPHQQALERDIEEIDADVHDLLQHATIPWVEQSKLVFWKATRTFAATFISTLGLTLLPVVEDLAKGNASFGLERSLLVAAVVGAVAAGVRAVIALLPISKADVDTGVHASLVH
jgi:hypothetical protein